MIERTTLGARQTTALIISIATLVLISGCTTIYAVKPSNSNKHIHLYDERAVTQTQGGIAVTVGSPGPMQTFLNFGILIANYKDTAIKVNFDDVKILVNGRALPIRTLAELQDEIRRIEKTEQWSTGLSAASTSLAQSNARMAASETAKSEGRALTQQLVDQHKSPAGLLAEANQALIQASNAMGRQRAADLAAQSSTISWRETASIRWDLNYQFTLGQMKTQEQYYWRSETIAPRQSVLRSVYVKPQAWKIEDIAKAGQHVDVEIRIGKLLFPFQFLLNPLSMGESSNEIQTWQKRNSEIVSQ